MCICVVRILMKNEIKIQFHIQFIYLFIIHYKSNGIHYFSRTYDY